jgi:hypothetical protein
LFFAVSLSKLSGHYIDSNCERPVSSKVDAIQVFSLSETVKALKAYFGIISYRPRFILQCFHDFQPLTDLLLRTQNDVVFTLDALQAFDAAKQAIEDAVMLLHLNP